MTRQSHKTKTLLFFVRVRARTKGLVAVDRAAGALVEALLCLPESVATSGTSGPEVVLLLTYDYGVALHGSQLSSIRRNSRGRGRNARLAMCEAGPSIKGIRNMVHSLLW